MCKELNIYVVNENKLYKTVVKLTHFDNNRLSKLCIYLQIFPRHIGRQNDCKVDIGLNVICGGRTRNCKSK
jgi:hypothetical protein